MRMCTPVVLIVCAFLFGITPTHAATWPGTAWVVDGEVVSATSAKSALDYLYERRSTGTNFHEPPLCYGGRNALQWDGSDWQCYSVPSPVTYSWYVSGWGGCSRSCGTGVQYRSVYCRGSDGNSYSDSYCSGSKPATSQSCNTHTCPPMCTSFAPQYGCPGYPFPLSNLWYMGHSDTSTCLAYCKARRATCCELKANLCYANTSSRHYVGNYYGIWHGYAANCSY